MKSRSVEIKSLMSPDLDVGAVEAAQEGSICFLLEIELGMKGQASADLFQVMVANPEGLRRLTPRDGVLTDRAMIVLREFSWPALQAVLQRIVDRCDTGDWNETVLRLQRYWRWEYEDYVEED